MSDRNHPVWALLNLVVILGFVLLFLKLNATNFDETEIKTIIGVAIGAGGWEGVKAWLRRTLQSNKEK